ncbi:hypothetical protein CHS0354_034076 [Potamilus streckersoni]|uniref:Uncharacterized protein n=1 Tax=Potamilus streckersoni TaxID=2493646 RepID=A0AAE0RVM8_9BIVA|nr:hypothetical protein CHS0354_034076 [Potamilus streckersoni]
MAFSFVELKYCLLLGLIKVSVGQAVGQETGSNVSITIDFQQYQTLCKELQIFFVRLAMEVNWQGRILSFSDDGDKCLSVVSNEYVQRISNTEVNIPISVTFILRNVSFLDTGKYSARSKGKILGERILFVTDRTLRACTGNEEEFDIVLPLSPFNEELNVMFYNIPMSPLAVIRVADTAPPVCATNVKYLQCKVNRYSLSVTIKTVNFLNQGIYALIGNRTGVVHGSAILSVIVNAGEGCSTVVFTTLRMVDSSVVNCEPDCSKVTFTTELMITVTEVHEDTINEAAVGNSLNIYTLEKLVRQFVVTARVSMSDYNYCKNVIMPKS